MHPAEHAQRIVSQVGGVLPRSIRALAGTGQWNALSSRGMRQLGEVALDELVVSAMTLLAPPPQVHSDVSGYRAIAGELSELGVAAAHRDPEPLQLKDIHRRGAGAFAFEQLTFDHDPRLPACLGDAGRPATAVCNIVRHDDGVPRPWWVWVHGAGQGNMTDFAVARVARIHRTLGYNIAMPIQPGHGIRRNWWPAYPDTDPVANVAGMMRSVSEVRAVIDWLRPHASAVALGGLSLGSGVAALVAGLQDGIDGVVLYTPILGLNAMIANHLHRWGTRSTEVGAVFDSDEVRELTAVIDPLALAPRVPESRRVIVGAWHDQMAMRAPALAMHERWGGELYWHDGGHVGHLFAGEVQRVTERFLGAVAGS